MKTKIKNSMEEIKASRTIKGRLKIKELWSKQIKKIKQHRFTCPFCKESFAGIAAFGTHLKHHCT